MAVTNNFSLVLPAVGGDTNLWGGLLNNGVMTAVDAVLGNSLSVAMSSTDVTLTASQFQNAVFTITGTLTTNLNLIVPLSPNSATVACGGRFVVDNQSAGAFNITVKTEASGSAGVTVPQGLRTWLYSDGTDVSYCDDSKTRIVTVNGSPNGQLAGTTGTVNSPPYPLAFDYTNKRLYVPTTTGDATTTVWSNFITGSAPLPVALATNLAIKVVSTTTVSVSASYVSVTDGSGNFLVVTPSATINLGTTGANALDTGVIAAATWYSVWVIAKTDGTTATLASTSSTFGGLTLPSGYTYGGRVGWVRTAPAVAQLMTTWQYGNRAQYIIAGSGTTTVMPQAASGIAGSVTTPTWVAVSLTPYVPTTAIAVVGTLSTGTTNSVAMVAPNGSFGDYTSEVNPPPAVTYNAGSQNVNVQFSFLLESSSIYWAASASLAVLSILGWEDNL